MIDAGKEIESQRKALQLLFDSGFVADNLCLACAEALRAELDKYENKYHEVPDGATLAECARNNEEIKGYLRR